MLPELGLVVEHVRVNPGGVNVHKNLIIPLQMSFALKSYHLLHRVSSIVINVQLFTGLLAASISKPTPAATGVTKRNPIQVLSRPLFAGLTDRNGNFAGYALVQLLIKKPLVAKL